MSVQRWRLTFERGQTAAAQSQREVDAAWQAALAALQSAEAPGLEPPRIAIGAPLPVGTTAARDLADLFLPQRRRRADVRAALEPTLPAEHRLVDLYDVWLREPALPGLVIAADYRVTLACSEPPGATSQGPRRGIEAAVARLLASSELVAAGTRAGRRTLQNLRPLIVELRTENSPIEGSGTAELWMRLRFHPSLGTGRPDDVVAALGSILGQPMQAVRRHRERLWLRGELAE